MKTYEIEFTQVCERTVTVQLEAPSEEEAIRMARDGEYDIHDEFEAPEDVIEVRDFLLKEVENDD